MRRSQPRPGHPYEGVRRNGTGWQAAVKVLGSRSFQQFEFDTKPSVMQQWRADERARLWLQLSGKPSARGPFASDVKTYLALESIKKMPTFKERSNHLHEWCIVFGHRQRHQITALEVEQQRDAWMVSRGSDKVGHALPPYSAASINKRLRALSNLWSKLDGRRAPNPVLDVEEVEEPDAEARGLPYDVIEAILAEIPETWIGTLKSKARTPGRGSPRAAKNKARLRVIAYTGLSHSQLKLLTPADVDLEAATMRVVARRKGKKRRRAQDRPLPELLPLIPQAVEAFRIFDEQNCWGKFSNSSMWKLFQRACQRLGLGHLRPYDLRHSYGTMIYAETRDLRVTGKLLGHRVDRTTQRYTLAAVPPHVKEAIARVADRIKGTV